MSGFSKYINGSKEFEFEFNTNSNVQTLNVNKINNTEISSSLVSANQITTDLFVGSTLFPTLRNPSGSLVIQQNGNTIEIRTDSSLRISVNGVILFVKNDSGSIVLSKNEGTLSPGIRINDSGSIDIL